MQLPPSDELILASGTAPIRAKKVRYFEDRELQARILKPPIERNTVRRRAPAEDWADVAEPSIASAHVPTAPSAADRTNSGVRREPGLPGHEEVVKPTSKAAQEFEPPQESVPAPPTQRNLQKRFNDMTRQASLDLGDGRDM
jgi:type IV secretion system protein VirD4